MNVDMRRSQGLHEGAGARALQYLESKLCSFLPNQQLNVVFVITFISAAKFGTDGLRSAQMGKLFLQRAQGPAEEFRGGVYLATLACDCGQRRQRLCHIGALWR